MRLFPKTFPACLTLLGLSLSSALHAQTAPQLLPYTITQVAGGGGSAAIAAGATCPVSGLTSTDSYGDGCLATEVRLNAPRFVATDRNGALFFSDTGNAIIRRVDPLTGVITLVAGGASSSPAAGTSCGTAVSTSSDGDGCPATAIKLARPEGLAFSPAGDLYFAENSYDQVRKIASTNGVITGTGIVSHIVGNTTYGFSVNNTSTTPVPAATAYLDFPYGLAFDAAGNLYIADEGNNAIEVVNLTSASETIQGLTVPAGTISKIAGYGSLAAKSATSGDCPSFTSTSARGGCYFGTYTSGAAAVKSNLDGNYDLALDPAGNVFFSDEFLNVVPQVSAANLITSYAGIESTKSTTQQRGPAGSFGIGSIFNLALDRSANLYVSDDSNGLVWRVDAAGKSMYVVAGGASKVCASASDTAGDGCPATQATLSMGTLNSSGYSSTASTAVRGVAGLSVDPFGSLFLADATTNVIRRASSGTQFGSVGGNQPTQSIDLHFAAGDSPATISPYTLTAGTGIFTLGGATCTVNSDTTTDCVLPVTVSAVPTTATLGAFTGTLQVKSALGATATFTLGGTFVQTPVTRLAVAVAANPTCSGTTFSPTTPVTLTASIANTGGPSGAPTGTVTFFANGTQIGSPQPVSSSTATLTYTFATAGTYTITATYSGDSYFKTSSGASATQVVSSIPAFTATAVSSQQSTVTAGQTGLYSFTLTQGLYTGTISFACSGLPANSSCSFSPVTVAATGCAASNTVALSILTQAATVVLPAGFAANGHGPFALLGLFSSVCLALGVGLSRRGTRLGRLLVSLALLFGASTLVACGKQNAGLPATPSGTYTVTVTATGSTGGIVSSFTVPLKVQ